MSDETESHSVWSYVKTFFASFIGFFTVLPLYSLFSCVRWLLLKMIDMVDVCRVLLTRIVADPLLRCIEEDHEYFDVSTYYMNAFDSRDHVLLDWLGLKASASKQRRINEEE